MQILETSSANLVSSLRQVEDLLFASEIKSHLPLTAWFTQVTPKTEEKNEFGEVEGYKCLSIDFLQSNEVFPSLSPKPISKIWIFAVK